MMKHCGKLLLSMLVLCFAPALALAQIDCPALVQQALDAADKACEDTGRNQACYGNVKLEATPRDNVSDFALTKPGEKANVVDVQSLRLSSLNAATKEWGIAYLKIQANIPDDKPQNVTLLLFGDVQITDAPVSAPKPVLLTVTASKTINVRGEPATKGAKVGSLAAQQTATADGRNEAGDWLRIQLEGDKVGWVSTPLVTVDGDINTLPVKDAQDTTVTPEAPKFGPMQAFYFQSGKDDAPCEEAPDSGILIQTPEGVGEIDLLINEVNIQLFSTTYIVAQPSGEMTMNVVQGNGVIQEPDKYTVVPAGSRVRIPLDTAGAAAGAVSNPEPYTDADLVSLPVGGLERTITIAKARTQAEIDARSGPLTSLGLGNACQSGGVTQSFAIPKTGHTINGVSMGSQWFASKGVTATFTTSGNTGSRSDPIVLDNLDTRVGQQIRPFAQSGKSQTLTYTFGSPTRFMVFVAAVEGDTVTLTVTCQ